MNKSGEELSELLKAKINVNGELHLDKVLTAIMLKWVLSYERTLDNMFAEVVKMQADLGIKPRGDI